MVPWRATEDGYVTDDVVDWYARFATGKPGAIVVEATGIRDIPSGPLLRIGDDRFIPGLRRLVETVREASDGETRLLIQLIDFLRVRRRPTARTFFERFFQINDGHRERLAQATGDAAWLNADDGSILEYLAAVAADDALSGVLGPRELSDLRFGARERVNDTHLQHINDLPLVLPTLFADAALRAQTAGFDGVELHYAHAYTMASFLSRTNQRSDGYGGDLEGRLRLPLETYQAVRDAVGPEYTVGCRYLVDEVITGGSDVDDARRYGVAFAQTGMDFISLSKGGKFDDAHQPKVGHAVYPYTGQSGYECMPTVYSDERGPFSRNIELMSEVRQSIHDAGYQTPVVVAGGINDFEGAEEILQRGQGDVIGAARQSLADPDWFLKMRKGVGQEIRRCKFTNYCEALDTRHKQVTCQLWDRINIQEPRATQSRDGKRRLTAPDWTPST
jgi:dimethylglycine catabolism A